MLKSGRDLAGGLCEAGERAAAEVAVEGSEDEVEVRERDVAVRAAVQFIHD